MTGNKVAIYARVSTDKQTDLNQTMILEQWAKDRGWTVYGIYQETGSAWQNNTDQKELKKLIEDCRHGKFQTILIHDLSRITRRGGLDSLLACKRIAQVGGEVKSYTEAWLEQIANPMLREVLICIVGFLNQDSSRDKSVKTKAGMARAKAQGIHIGRPRKKGIEKTPVPFSIQNLEKTRE